MRKFFQTTFKFFFLAILVLVISGCSSNTSTQPSSSTTSTASSSLTTPKPTTAANTTQSELSQESQPKTTIEDFPKKLEDYLNNTWDELPGTSYKVYWWDTWEGVDSGNTHLVVEPSFEPTKEQCQRIAQVATIDRVKLLGKKEGVVHVVKNGNSGDYCSLRTP